VERLTKIIAIIEPQLGKAVMEWFTLGIGGRQDMGLNIAAQSWKLQGNPTMYVEPVTTELFNIHPRLPLEEKDYLTQAGIFEDWRPLKKDVILG